jgi:hypothetical protein
VQRGLTGVVSVPFAGSTVLTSGPKGASSLAEPIEQSADLRERVYTLLLTVEKYVDTSTSCLGAASTVELVSGCDNLA